MRSDITLVTLVAVLLLHLASFTTAKAHRTTIESSDTSSSTSHILATGSAFSHLVGGDDSNFDVKCGDQDGLCSYGNPICCGAVEPYCIPGGQKCCTSLAPPFMSNILSTEITSCGVYQECCHGGAPNYDVTCCNQTQSCQNGQCVPDRCSNTSDPNFCISHAECEWCCASRLCQKKGVSAYCPTNDILRQPGEQCTDRCTYYDNCFNCTMAMESSNDGKTCQWCAAHQRCMDSQEIENSCYNGQFVITPDKCSRIGPTGHGLRIVTTFSNALTPVILVTLCVTILVIVFLSVLRWVVYRRRMNALMDIDADMAVTSTVARRAQAVLPKYGFKEERTRLLAKRKEMAENAKKLAKDGRDEGEKEEGVSAEEDTPSDALNGFAPLEVLEGDLILCPLCDRKIQLPQINSQPPPVPPPAPEDEEEEKPEGEGAETKAREAADTEEATSTVVPIAVAADALDEASPRAVPAAQSRSETGSSSSSDDDSNDGIVPPPEPGAEVADASASAADESKGSKLVIVLPCYHFCCVECARETLKKAKEEQAKAEETKQKKSSARKTSKKAKPADESSSTNAAEDTSQPGNGEAAAKESEEKPDLPKEAICPQCGETITAVLVPSKVIHN